MQWPDIVVGIVLGLGAFNGWRTGLVAELTGIVALIAGIAAAFAYPGIWDGYFHEHFNLGNGSAHVLAMFAYAGVAYGIVAAVGFILERFAKLPIVNIANAALGAGLGLAKSVVFVWVVLYVALFFPLSKDLRQDLHHSPLIGMISSKNNGIDDKLKGALPQFTQPYSTDVFAHHRV